MAADIYSCPPNTGRGGWTWYTGSAAWMYRTGVEWILGFRVEGGLLRLDPCIPRTWSGFAMTLRYGTSRYEISVENPQEVSRGIASAALDGDEQQPALTARGAELPLADDGKVHRVRVVLGAPPPGDGPSR